jgi:hypothetical protein
LSRHRHQILGAQNVANQLNAVPVPGQHRFEAFGDDLVITDEHDTNGSGLVGEMHRLVHWRPGRSTDGVLSESHRNFAQGARRG